MFKVTHNKGFAMTFANGYTVSVQWGGGNYCDNRSLPFRGVDAAVPASKTAEVAVWNADGEWVALTDHDDVIGYQTPEQVAAIIAKYSAI